MLNVGLANLDTSHVIAFSQRLHHKGVAEDQWVEGALTTHAWRGESNVRTPAQVEEYAQQLHNEFGVQLVDSLAELVAAVDVACIEANEGWRHLGQATPFLQAGKRCWIDKPFAGDFQQAKRIMELATEHKTQVFSCSSLRFGDEMAPFKEAHPEITGVDVIGPAPQHWANPGLLHYGIHGVEILYALMGPGCVSVSCLSLPDQEVCVGHWADGRIGTLRGLHNGPWTYAFRATTRGQNAGVHTVTINTSTIYRNLLRHMVHFFETGETPFDPAETLEIAGFMDAAAQSAKMAGQPAAMPW
ncbi:MAG: Gfo/Idh/MocA family oxidoreductase [Fimbriimonadaceae bacterium]|nr:Gfo/Idh/MocA family oxidoreductase [Fimbriimonadaceae bacterium]